MKIVHTCDWHLSSQRGRIDPETGINARLMDFYRCARFCIEDGIAKGAELILHAGDAFHSCRPTPTEVHLFREAISPAIEAKVPVVIIVGNHDAPRSPHERHALDLVRDIEGLTIVDRPCLLNLWREGEVWRISVVRIDSGVPQSGDTTALQIACLPWPNKQLLLIDERHRKLESGQLNQLMQEKMMDCVRGLTARLVPFPNQIPSILLGHFAVDLSKAGTTNRLMALGGEWTLNANDLLALPFSYFALGHIHKPQEILLDESRPMIYAGAPEAVSFGEEGEAKQYTLVSIDDQGPVSFEWSSTPYRKFVTVDLTSEDPLLSLYARLQSFDLKGAIVRVKVAEHQDIDLAQLRKELSETGAFEYQIEVERAHAARERAANVSSTMAPNQALRAWLGNQGDLAPMTDEVLAEARAVEQQITGDGKGPA